MPLIRPLPNILVNTDLIRGAVYDPGGPVLHVYFRGPEPTIYRADQAEAVWAAICEHVVSPPSTARSMVSGLEEIFTRIEALERIVHQIEDRPDGSRDRRDIAGPSVVAADDKDHFRVAGIGAVYGTPGSREERGTW